MGGTMSSVIISGDTSGSVTLQAPAISGNTTVTLPVTSMNIGNGGGGIATNTAMGASALNANTTGLRNTGVGALSLASNTTGQRNNALGYETLNQNTTGSNNTAVGEIALYSNNASNNTALGYTALWRNTSGSSNTAVGAQSLDANTVGTDNTAVGYRSSYTQTNGTYNVAIGALALYTNAGYSYNTAIGYKSLYTVSQNSNTAVGYQAGLYATTGYENVFLGANAGNTVTTGIRNTIIGNVAGSSLTTGSNNTFVGANGASGGCGEAVTTGSKNTILGGYTGNQGSLDIRTSSNFIVFSDGDGNPRAFINSTGFFKAANSNTNLVGGASGTFHEISQSLNQPIILLSNTASDFADWGIQLDITRNTTNNSFYPINYYNRGAATTRFRVADSGNVTNTNNSYGSISDVKLKENIADATPKLDKLMQVKVRQYNLKSDPDHKQIGVVAQELEEVFPSMVDESPDKDEDGNDLGTTTKQVKYSVFVPMLIKAVQELNAKVIELEAKLESK